MDCTAFSWFIYGSFTPCGHASCLDSVTIFINYRPLTLMRGWIIAIDGRKHPFAQGDVFEVSGIRFTFDGMMLIGRHEELGLTVSYDG